MLEPLKKLEVYLTNLTDPSQLSGRDLISLLDEIREPFESHFNEEISVLASLSTHRNNPEPGSEAERKTIAAFDKWGQDSLMQPGITDVLVFFLLNMDRDYEEGIWRDWPPIPTPARWAITNVAGLWHNSWWKFASCDASGRRKELYACH